MILKIDGAPGIEAIVRPTRSVTLRFISLPRMRELVSQDKSPPMVEDVNVGYA